MLFRKLGKCLAHMATCLRECAAARQVLALVLTRIGRAKSRMSTSEISASVVARQLLLVLRESLTMANQLGSSLEAVNEALVRLRDRGDGCMALARLTLMSRGSWSRSWMGKR
jgi:hypothetical protein